MSRTIQQDCDELRQLCQALTEANRQLRAENERLRAGCEMTIDFLNEIDDYNAGQGRATPETVLELRGTVGRALSG